MLVSCQGESPKGRMKHVTGERFNEGGDLSQLAPPSLPSTAFLSTSYVPGYRLGKEHQRKSFNTFKEDRLKTCYMVVDTVLSSG